MSTLSEGKFPPKYLKFIAEVQADMVPFFCLSVNCGKYLLITCYRDEYVNKQLYSSANVKLTFKYL